MAEQDLLTWALDHYFDSWELERAELILKKDGMEVAVEFLRKLAADSWRGYSGPNHPSYDTKDGKVRLRSDGISGEPDLVCDLRWFCQRKLESLFQMRML